MNRFLLVSWYSGKSPTIKEEPRFKYTLISTAQNELRLSVFHQCTDKEVSLNCYKSSLAKWNFTLEYAISSSTTLSPPSTCRFTSQRFWKVRVHRIIHERRDFLVCLPYGEYSWKTFVLLHWRVISSRWWRIYLFPSLTTSDVTFLSLTQVEKTSTAKSLHRTPDPSTFPSAPGAPEIINVTENSVTISWPTSHDGTSSSGSLIG